MPSIRVRSLPSRKSAATFPPTHWIGNPPTHFQNPWPSYKKTSFRSGLYTRFGPNRNFVPVPENRHELVKVRTPDWGRTQQDWKLGLKATWLGHAGFLIETAAVDKAKRGVRILFDAVFSERTSPVSFLGPKRYTPTPCQLEDLPEIDLIILSHDHYDHLDFATIKYVYDKQKQARRDVHFFAGLRNKRRFLKSGLGIQDDEVTECDWWDEQEVTVEGIGTIRLACTPAQHTSGRTGFDAGSTLWCSWVVEDTQSDKRLYFAGDTAYKTTTADSPCPAFADIGNLFGPFDLALLPIGLCSPPSFMSNVHCTPDQTLEIHKAIRSKKSIGKHWGTFRGGLSQYYEPVTEPPRKWRECAEKEGLWGTECLLCDVGETVMV